MIDRRSHVFAAMVASSLLLAVFVVLQKSPTGWQSLDVSWALLVGIGWAAAPWLIGLAVAGINAGVAKIRRRNMQIMRDFVWATGVMMIMLVVATIANP